MSTNQSTGRGYIPKFFRYNGSTEWRPNTAYSALTIVTRKFKVFTSNVNVPSNVGEPEDNPLYWQELNLPNEVLQSLIDELSELADKIDSIDVDLTEFDERLDGAESEISELQDDVSEKAANIVSNASGSVASFADGADGVPVIDLVSGIEPVQEGTGDPSPTNVRPITGWSRVNVAQSADAPEIITEFAQGTLQSTTGGTFDNTRRVRTNYYSVESSTEYVIYTNLPFVGFFEYSDTNSSHYIQRQYVYNEPAVFRSSATTKYVRLLLGYSETQNSGAETSPDDVQYCWFCKKDGSAFYPVTFPSEAGIVYGGTLDVTTGVLTVDKTIITFDENTSFSDISADSHTFYVENALPEGSTAKTSEASPMFLCDQYKETDSIANSSEASGKASGTFFNQNTFRRRIFVKNDNYSTAQSFAESLEGNNIHIVCPLPTALTYQCTPTEVRSLLGVNNIWADTGDVYVDYVADTKKYVDGKLSATQQMMELIVTANRETSMTASKPYSANDLVIINGTLYKVDTSIANGGTFTIGTNISATTVAEQLAAIAL